MNFTVCLSHLSKYIWFSLINSSKSLAFAIKYDMFPSSLMMELKSFIGICFSFERSHQTVTEGTVLLILDGNPASTKTIYIYIYIYIGVQISCLNT